MLKTREEVESLKAEWLADPCWDIYESEGFEEYRVELKLFQEECNLAFSWEREEEEESEKLEAENLGLHGLFRLINRYGSMAERHQEAIRALINGDNAGALKALGGNYE